MNKSTLILLIFLFGFSCKHQEVQVSDLGKKNIPFDWKNASIYFLLTDRFNNGDPTNDFKEDDNKKSAPFRGYMGGDVKGITAKIKEGYFDKLGVQAIWMTPLVENIAGAVDEGTGLSYGFHGYWTKDWTAIDKRIGTASDVKEMVKTAHEHGIKVLFDVVVNHTGPVTKLDQKWPDEWVKTGPRCIYKDYETTVNCTLVDNLPDIRTESSQDVTLPNFLVEKWKLEGRYDQEMKELDEFFTRTNYPRRPYYYIIKWLTDLISDYGIDGYRVDTTKHTEEEVWKVLAKESHLIFENYKRDHNDEQEDWSPFYMVGEVYNYFISGGREYDYGDKKVDFFSNGFDGLINFDFKTDAQKPYEDIFVKYDSLLHKALDGKTVLNYISSHDDGGPFDIKRERSIEAGTKLMLTPGQCQIYYGDESARSLTVEAQGDATLRSFMNWEEQNDKLKSKVLLHWQKLGLFRKNHLAVGMGYHAIIAQTPYTFSRIYNGDRVVVALDAAIGKKQISVGNVFKNGTRLKDTYSNKSVVVANGYVDIDSDENIVLLEEDN